MKNEAKKRIRRAKNLSLLPELVIKIEKLGASNGRSLSSYIEQLMREDVERYEKENGPIKLPEAGKQGAKRKPALPPKHLRPGYVAPEADGKTA